MKIRTLIVLLSVLLAMALGALAWLGVSSLGRVGGVLQGSSAQAEKYAHAINAVRQSQVNFQRQVQEWKNILIRGNNEKAYEKYLLSFERHEALVQGGLRDSRQVFSELDIPLGELDKLLIDHAALGKSYREALANFNAADPETGKKVDKMLQGIDRAASKGMDDVAELIERTAASKLAEASSSGYESASKNRQLFLFGAAAAAVVMILLLLFINHRLKALLGQEPAVMTEFFNKLASGELNAKIETSDSDSESLAASAKMMQMKVRALIVAIRDNAQEVERAANEARSEQGGRSVRETTEIFLRAKESIDKAVSKFKL